MDDLRKRLVKNMNPGAPFKQVRLPSIEKPRPQVRVKTAMNKSYSASNIKKKRENFEIPPKLSRPKLRSEYFPKPPHKHGERIEVAEKFDILKFIHKIQHEQRLANDFWYLTRGNHIYDLQLVEFQQIKQEEYLTISLRGITHFHEGDMTFYSINQYIQEFLVFEKLKSLSFFKLYRKFKTFKRWKLKRRKKVIEKIKETFEKQWVLANVEKLRLFCNIRELEYNLLTHIPIDIDMNSTRKFPDFVEINTKKFPDSVAKVKRIHEKILETMNEIINLSKEESTKYFPPITPEDLNIEEKVKSSETALKINMKNSIKLIRLIDYTIIQAKLDNAQLVYEHVKNCVTPKFNTLAVNGRSKIIKAKPVFIVKCWFNTNGTQLEPPFDSFIAFLKKMLYKATYELQEFECLIFHPDFEIVRISAFEYAENVDIAPISIQQFFDQSTNLPMLEEAISSVVRQGFDQMVGKTNSLETFIDEYYDNRLINPDDYYYFTGDLFSESFEKFLSQSERFEAIPSFCLLDVFTLDLSIVKKKLRSSPTRCREVIVNMIPEILSKRTQEIVKLTAECYANISKRPRSVKDYVNMVLNSKHSGPINEMKSKEAELRFLILFINKYFIELTSAVEAQIDECLKGVTGFYHSLSENLLWIDVYKEKFTLECKRMIEMVSLRARSLKTKLEDPMISNPVSEPLEVHKYLSSFKEEIEELVQDVDTFSVFKEVLSIKGNFTNLVVESRMDFNTKYNLWKALHDWEIFRNDIYAKKYREVELKEASSKMNELFKIVQQSKMLENHGNSVPGILRGKLEDFQTILLILEDLHCPSLKPRHWDQLSDSVEGKLNFKDMSLTVGELIEADLAPSRDDILEIALRARKEEEIKKKLKEIAAEWENVEFHFGTYKDTPIFIDTNEIVEKLDDTLVKLSAVSSSRFISLIKEKVQATCKKFSLCAQVLDEWLLCQKQWEYLGKIYLSPDMTKQMYDKAKKFLGVHNNFRELMTDVYYRPNVMKAVEKEGRLKHLKYYNKTLETLQKDLETFLDKKRKAFPRFYFVSNDELLYILAHSSVISEIEPSLGHIFDGVSSLVMLEGKAEDIEAVKSPEGERLMMPKNTKIRENVAEWLGNLEKSIKVALKNEIRLSLKGEDSSEKPVQVALLSDIIMWVQAVEEALQSRDPTDALSECLESTFEKLDTLTQLATQTDNSSIISLVIQQVHNRDLLLYMRDEDVANVFDFEWKKQLRYYWNPETSEVQIQHLNATFEYGYEYLGAYSRQVITPLTERCWLTITSALLLKQFAAAIGPAGTGKTECIRDVARVAGRYCLVFNCSEEVSYKMMERLLLGLCSTGAWSSIDEFNRIELEVISVIASQLLAIRQSKLEEAEEVLIEDQKTTFDINVGVFITMNPGYLGRSELPDNIKILFRSLSMLIPDYEMISEILLLAEGFKSAKPLSVKVFSLYMLASEQLSYKNFYDFGMRSIKSVLKMAGFLNRTLSNLSEEELIVKAIVDSNYPKLTKEDEKIMDSLIQDLFPNIVIHPDVTTDLKSRAEELICAKGLDPYEPFISKIMQLGDILKVRFGVIMIGKSFSGKSKIIEILAELQSASFTSIYPKAASMGELYGEFDDITHDWRFGIASGNLKEFTKSTKEEWAVFDGPIDSLWVENLNSVLDENKLLCLGNGERIRLTDNIRILFEVEDLHYSSPSTVSRCGIIYVHSNTLTWRSVVAAWAKTLDWDSDHKDYILNLINAFMEKLSISYRKTITEAIPTLDNSLVNHLCRLIGILSRNAKAFQEEFEVFTKFIGKVFVFAATWSFGSCLDDRSALRFNILLNTMDNLDFPKGSVYDYWVNTEKIHGEFVLWSKLRQSYSHNPKNYYHDIIVPTSDLVKLEHIIGLNMSDGHHSFISGDSGSGKSVTGKSVLTRLQAKHYYPVQLHFSGRTSASFVYSAINSKLFHIKKNILGGPLGKKVSIMIDDIHHPIPELYGAQPAIELLREFCDTGSILDRELHTPIHITESTLICCAGRGNLPLRFTRLFHTLALSSTNEESLTDIFYSMVEGFLHQFSKEVHNTCMSIVASTISVYLTVTKDLLPTPKKSHYLFSLKDLSKVIQGLFQATPAGYTNQESIINLWRHETMRVFHDRLVDQEDRDWLTKTISKIEIRNFRNIHNDSKEVTPHIYGDFLSKSRAYLPFPNIQILSKTVFDYVRQYSEAQGKAVKVILYTEALEQICKICRILRFDNSHGILIGAIGCGKKFLARLAVFISQAIPYDNETCLSEETKKEDTGEENKASSESNILKEIYQKAGINCKKVAYLTEMSTEHAFMEDLSNLISMGEVPGLFTKEELEHLEQELKIFADKQRVSVEHVYDWFVRRARSNLHVLLMLSPGETKSLIRDFPGIVHSSTVIWFDKWPEEALISIGSSEFYKHPFRHLERLESRKLQGSLSSLSVFAHMSVEKMAESFLARNVHIAPTIFFDLIRIFFELFKRVSENAQSQIDIYSKGIEKFNLISQELPPMQANLINLNVFLTMKKTQVENLENELTESTFQADSVRREVENEENRIHQKHEKIKRIQSNAEEDLNSVLPVLEKATKALDLINPVEIAEIRTFPSPPPLVVYTLECIAILMEQKTDWDNIKRILSANFLDALKNFPRNRIKKMVLGKLKLKIEENPKFTPQNVGLQNQASKSLCEWVFAMEHYAKVLNFVQPKQKKVKRMNKMLQESQIKLEAIREKLKKQLEVVKELQNELQKVNEEHTALNLEIEQTHSRLSRASILIEYLQDEEIRWQSSLSSLKHSYTYLIGDSFLASASILYMGPFDLENRSFLLNKWIERATELGVPINPDFSLQSLMGDPLVIRDWLVNSLPNDSRSIENAIILTESLKPSLCIDPQQRANKWIKSFPGIKTVKVSDALKCILAESSQVLLIEDIGDALSSELINAVCKCDVKVYLTSKLQYPQYSAQIYGSFNVIDFTINAAALQEQLLAKLAMIEKPRLEYQRRDLQKTIAKDNKDLRELERKILESVSGQGGNLLDDQRLVINLRQSKGLSTEITKRVEQSKLQAEKYNSIRNSYKSICSRATLVYFLSANLIKMDPMYDFSLKFFSKIFKQVLNTWRKEGELKTQKTQIINSLTFTLYKNISQGLFKNHKLTFSFLLAVSIQKEEGLISEAEWNFLIAGPSKSEPCDSPSAIPRQVWATIQNLAEEVSSFANFPDLLEADPDFYVKWSEQPSALLTSLTPFQNLLLIKALKPDKTSEVVYKYIESILGKEYLQDYQLSYNDILELPASTPILFLLSAGADPLSIVTSWEKTLEVANKFKVLSLGKGQGPRALKLIEVGSKQGNWVMIQNCHLLKSWLLSLEELLQSIPKYHRDFKLFLTTSVCDYFPSSILQSSLKITNEAPKSIRNNLRLSLEKMENPTTTKHRTFNNLFISLSLMHAVILERRKFGPSGWTQSYEFNSGDLETAIQILLSFLNDDGVNWKAMKYMLEVIVYGGRVTDQFDQLRLRSIVSVFVNRRALKPGYRFFDSEVYTMPFIFKISELDRWVETLPYVDTPDIFGLHSQANIMHERIESQTFLEALVNLEPKDVSSVSKDFYQKVIKISNKLLERTPEIIEEGRLDVTNPMDNFVARELERFNKLIMYMKENLGALVNAIEGGQQFNSELEKLMSSVYSYIIPQGWVSQSYPSNKSLWPWMQDLSERINYIRQWVSGKTPSSYCLNTFFSPGGFLSAVLQVQSRALHIPVDSLSLSFTYMNFYLDDLDEAPKVGVFLHGMFTENCRIDLESLMLADSFLPFHECPILMMEAVPSQEKKENIYMMPVYRTQRRAGSISTTGKSTNFIVCVGTSIEGKDNDWILKGAALIHEID